MRTRAQPECVHFRTRKGSVWSAKGRQGREIEAQAHIAGLPAVRVNCARSRTGIDRGDASTALEATCTPILFAVPMGVTCVVPRAGRLESPLKISFSVFNGGSTEASVWMASDRFNARARDTLPLSRGFQWFVCLVVCHSDLRAALSMRIVVGWLDLVQPCTCRFALQLHAHLAHTRHY